ncbi:MAG: hypothetical protein HY904_21645 [Deltaproteobacteria bacterium]|nr:hypothetical protein [Deltaproteobacteria bacterium]
MKQPWSVLVVVAAAAGAGVGWLAWSGQSLVPAWALGLAVALAGGAYPAHRMRRVRQRTAHPREWLNVNATPAPDGTLVVRSAADVVAGVPSLVLAGVPADLDWLAGQLLQEIVDARGAHPLVASQWQHNLAHPGQQLPHRVTLVPDGGALRVEETGTGSARGLLVAHLNAQAEPVLGGAIAETLLRRSLALWPGDPGPADDGTPAPPNENNCMAYKALGDTQFERGDQAGGLALLARAVRASPRWARAFADEVKRAPPPPKEDARWHFWLELGADSAGIRPDPPAG